MQSATSYNVYIGGKHKIPTKGIGQEQDFWSQLCSQGLIETGESFVGFVDGVSFTATQSNHKNIGHRLKAIHSIGEINIIDINPIDDSHVPDLAALAKIIKDYAQKLSGIPSTTQVEELLPAFSDSSWRVDRYIEVTDDGKIVVGWSIYIRHKDKDAIIAYRDFKCKGSLNQVIKRCDADELIQQAKNTLAEKAMRIKCRLIDDDFAALRQYDRIRTETLDNGLTNVVIQGVKPADIPAIIKLMSLLAHTVI